MKDLFTDLKNTMVFLKGHYLEYFAGIIGMTILYASTSLVESYLLNRLIDMGTPDSVLVIVKISMFIIVYMLIILWLLPKFTFMFNGTAKYGHGNVNKKLYQKIGKLSINYYEKNHSGEVLSVFYNDSWVVSAIFMRHFRRTVASFATIVVFIIAMMMFDYRITIVIVFLNLLTLSVNTGIAAKLRKTNKEIQSELGNMNVTLSNIISGMSVVRMYNLSKKMLDDFSINNSKVSELNMKNNKESAKLGAYNFTVSMLNMLVFLVIGSVMVRNNLTTYGDILAIMSLQTALDANFREFGDYYPALYNGLAGTERVYNFLNLEEETQKYELDRMNDPEYIEFRDVCFRYTPENPVLEKFNLRIKKGETLAIVGESGSGKSSIAKLLLGFYMPESGSIAVGGKNIADMTLEQIRNLVAYVPQDATLFGTSIMENIRYGNPNATDEEVIEAAKAANAHEFILEQEYGYETNVGEKGIRLSGGQCQRVAIARAILKNAPILLLDEATSALDTESERLIKETIDAYGKTRTTIIIAHRLSTIENADRIFSMA